MAKLSAHGNEIGRVYFTTYAKAYMADGKVLKNYGQGWKLTGKCKPDVTPEQAFNHAKQAQLEFLSNRPALKAYRTALHNAAGLCHRWKIHAAINLMPDDADGVWSETCDGYGENASMDIDEVSSLCRLYKDAESEQNAIKSTVTA